MSTQIIPARAPSPSEFLPPSTFSFCPEFRMWIIPPVQCGSRPRGGEEMGKRWGRGAKLEFLSSAQRERAPRCHIFRDEIENVSLLTGTRLWIYWHSPEEEHSAQNTANGRQTSVSQIFNIEQKLKQQNMKLGHKSKIVQSTSNQSSRPCLPKQKSFIIVLSWF